MRLSKNTYLVYADITEVNRFVSKIFKYFQGSNWFYTNKHSKVLCNINTKFQVFKVFYKSKTAMEIIIMKSFNIMDSIIIEVLFRAIHHNLGLFKSFGSILNHYDIMRKQ